MILAREKPSEWRLFTNERVTTLEETDRRVSAALAHGHFFFRIVKGGCRVAAL
ncbi:hypothetical protein [Candidatus Methylocalor cossyra]|uniref:Uncharacterized protein n=1 Tax=Candidatus Methylocalor cossyra TaxID=3108543 RepID=A0ABM9NJ09_9GAMM